MWSPPTNSWTVPPEDGTHASKLEVHPLRNPPKALPSGPSGPDFRGAPNFLPSARALAIPARVRSRMSSRSNSANAAAILRCKRPAGGEVSIP